MRTSVLRATRARFPWLPALLSAPLIPWSLAVPVTSVRAPAAIVTLAITAWPGMSLPGSMPAAVGRWTSLSPWRMSSVESTALPGAVQVDWTTVSITVEVTGVAVSGVGGAVWKSCLDGKIGGTGKAVAGGAQKAAGGGACG